MDNSTQSYIAIHFKKYFSFIPIALLTNLYKKFDFNLSYTPMGRGISPYPKLPQSIFCWDFPPNHNAEG